MNDNDTRNDTPASSGSTENALDAAKQKLASLAEKAKEHDFKEDARKAAEGVKNLADDLKQRDFKEDARKAAEGAKALKESLGKHDFKAELREAFAETKKNPASLWKKPDALRPGKDLAIAGLAASVAIFLFLFVTSSSFLGCLCLLLAAGALLFSLLGLKTEGRKLAIGGSVVSLLAILCAFGQTFGSSGGGAEDEDVDSGKPSGKDLALLKANEGQAASDISEIIEKSKNAERIDGLGFFGFYTGMSYADAKAMRKHYDLNEKQVWFGYNWKNGEVFKMCFTPKAIKFIMDVATNFETVEMAMLEYFDIVAWSNQRDVDKGEIDSFFQDDMDKFVWGDAADVTRTYKTSDGVVARLFTKGWDSNDKAVFMVLDTNRAKAAETDNGRFKNNNKMRRELIALRQKNIPTVMLTFGDGIEFLMKGNPGTDDLISAFTLDARQFSSIVGKETGMLLKPDPDAIVEVASLVTIDPLLTFVRKVNDLPEVRQSQYRYQALLKGSNISDPRKKPRWEQAASKHQSEIQIGSSEPKKGILLIAHDEYVSVKGCKELRGKKLEKYKEELDEAWYSSGEIKHMTREQFAHKWELEKDIVVIHDRYFVKPGYGAERKMQEERMAEEEKARKEKAEREKQEAIAKAEAEAIAKKEQMEAQKRAEEKAQLDQKEIEKARAEKAEVKKIAEQLEAFANKGFQNCSNYVANLSTLEPALDSVLDELKKVPSELESAKAKANELRANQQYEEAVAQETIVSELKAKLHNLDNAISDLRRTFNNSFTFNNSLELYNPGIQTTASKAKQFVGELEARAKYDMNMANKIRETAPREAIEDWESSAAIMNKAREGQQRLLEDYSGLIERMAKFKSKIDGK